ncbi:MAG TPA: glycosyltransferase family 2 protein [Stellaceae bacterium]|nr:glycosyltransferase family 2 protein [Stellaceae bacterium]
MTVSIIMVSFNTGPVLFAAIESGLRQAGLSELVLVDNGNPPEVSAELQAWSRRDPRLVLIAGQGNVGFAKGCNLGARAAAAAKGSAFLFLNPDCELETGTLVALMAAGAALPRPFLLGCRLQDPDGAEQRGSRRELLTPWTALVESLRLDRLIPNHPLFKRLNRHEGPLPKEITPVPAISGAAMMMMQEDFWAIGGFDEGYFLHVEDLDFCYRFRQVGGEIYFVPGIAIRHHRGTSKARPLRIEWHKMRGFLRYFRKHFSRSPFALLLPVASAGILMRFLLKAAMIGARGAMKK